MTDINVRNAIHRMGQYIEKGIFWQDAFEKVSLSFDLTAEEMDEVERITNENRI